MILGDDLVAVDATAARLMTIDPGQIPYLVEAGRFLGNIDPENILSLGEELAACRQNLGVIDRFQHLKVLHGDGSTASVVAVATQLNFPAPEVYDDIGAAAVLIAWLGTRARVDYRHPVDTLDHGDMRVSVGQLVAQSHSWEAILAMCMPA